jgi:glutamate/tyrosine decarboxylase-like PLP-dependent enzyme
VGWIVWRDAAALPEDLIFWVNYLGDNMPTFALNFSRPGAQIVAQYYNFLRLGFAGYRNVHGYARDVATRMSTRIAELGPFELITKGDELPVFAFKLTDDVDNFTVFDVSNAVRETTLALLLPSASAGLSPSSGQRLRRSVFMPRSTRTNWAAPSRQSRLGSTSRGSSRPRTFRWARNCFGAFPPNWCLRLCCLLSS